MRLSQLARSIAWLTSEARTGPLSDNWGREWGTPIDRWYIERFLGAHAVDIRGDVLEIMDDRYTARFGADVRTSTILDIDSSNPRATLVADISQPDSLPRNRFNCIVLTQTLQYVFDLQAAVQSIHRTLRPGGVCLATVPAVSRLDSAATARGEFWRVTPAGCSRLFGEQFGGDAVEVTSCGNTRTAICFLLGLAAEDLSERELSAVHPAFPLVVTVRAMKRRALR
jgi:SAM-dependent methyltransferase